MCLLNIITYFLFYGFNPFLGEPNTHLLSHRPDGGRLGFSFTFAEPELDFKELFPNATTLRFDELNKGSLEKCYVDLGCIVIDEDFFSATKRPVNFLPASRESINTTFLLYTRNNSKEYSEIKAKNDESIRRSNFSPTKETKFIVHGYIEEVGQQDWIEGLKDALLLTGDFNVIIVDWSDAARPPYIQAVANTLVVGAEIAFLIKDLEENHGLKPEDVHIIGHSLGAQVAGYAGAKVQKMGRITGLDPAGPLYEGMPPNVRLDPTDANFVDVIHTNGMTLTNPAGFGDINQLGNMDFYVNGGSKQPGCPKTEATAVVIHGLQEGVRRFVFCDHIRSVALMIDSLTNSRRPMVGFACQDYESFKSGACYDCGVDSERCAAMGLDAIRNKPKLQQPAEGSIPQVKFYLETRESAPYVVSQFQVTLKLKATGNESTGNLYLTLHGSRKSVQLQLGDRPVHLKPGQLYNFLITTPSRVENIAMVTFEWSKTTYFGIPILLPSWDKIYVDWIRVTPMNAADIKVQELDTGIYCERPTPQIAYSRNPYTIIRAEAEKCGLVKTSLMTRNL